MIALMPELTEGVMARVGDLTSPVKAGRSALAVFVADRPWRDAIRFKDGGAGRRESMPGVTVQVRGDKDDAGTGRALALRIADEMSEIAPPDGYFDCRALGSGVHELGPDGDGFPRWMVLFMMKRDERPLPVYSGASVDATLNAAFVLALTPTPKKLRRFHVFTATAHPGERLWLALPQRFGTPSFFSGFTGRTPIAFSLRATLTLTLASGDETFLLWGSDALGLGATTVKTL